MLQDTIKLQRFLYFGCVPITINEKHVEKLKQINTDKKLAFKALLDALIGENECEVLKETLQEQIINLQNLEKLNDDDVKILFGLQEGKQTLQLQVRLSLLGCRYSALDDQYTVS